MWDIGCVAEHDRRLGAAGEQRRDGATARQPDRGARREQALQPRTPAFRETTFCLKRNSLWTSASRVLGGVRAYSTSHLSQPPPAPPEFPAFPIKACVLGKVFAGKTAACRQFANSKHLILCLVEHTLNLKRDTMFSDES